VVIAPALHVLSFAFAAVMREKEQRPFSDSPAEWHNKKEEREGGGV